MGTDSKPGATVTLALFAFNQERFIREAVASVLAQACDPIEIILSDDASTDATFRVMQEAAADYRGPHRIVLNRNPVNLGLVAHVNKVFAMASGGIVVLAAGDDVSLPSRVSDTIEAFQRHPDVAMVSFTDEIIDADGSSVREHATKGTETMFGLSEFIALGPWAQRTLQISGASRAILGSTIATFGALAPECQAEDTPYVLRSLYCGKGLVCHWAGIRYRRHPDQLSTERSIASMDPGSFTRQYLRDLETARSDNLLDARLGAEVERWIDDTDLFFRLRRIDYARDGLAGPILFRAMRSSALSPREKLGLAKRYLSRGFLGDRLRRGKAHLIDLSLEPREYLRHVAFGQARTDSARWALESSFHRDWDARTKLIARHVHAGDRVAEFGAGLQALRNALPQDCVYQPFDLVARTDDTRVCDLNTGFPEIDGDYDVAVFSGVLEYLRDLGATFDWLAGNFERVVLSYAPSDLMASPLARNRHGWVNNLSRREVVRLARRSGFECRIVDTWRNHVIFVAVRQ
jgi:glycosyltransferase involved in cell wall biosynthesis